MFFNNFIYNLFVKYTFVEKFIKKYKDEIEIYDVEEDIRVQIEIYEEDLLREIRKIKKNKKSYEKYFLFGLENRIKKKLEYKNFVVNKFPNFSESKEIKNIKLETEKIYFYKEKFNKIEEILSKENEKRNKEELESILKKLNKTENECNKKINFLSSDDIKSFFLKNLKKIFIGVIFMDVIVMIVNLVLIIQNIKISLKYYPNIYSLISLIEIIGKAIILYYFIFILYHFIFILYIYLFSSINKDKTGCENFIKILKKYFKEIKIISFIFTYNTWRKILNIKINLIIGFILIVANLFLFRYLLENNHSLQENKEFSLELEKNKDELKNQDYLKGKKIKIFYEEDNKIISTPLIGINKDEKMEICKNKEIKWLNKKIILILKRNLNDNISIICDYDNSNEDNYNKEYNKKIKDKLEILELTKVVLNGNKVIVYDVIKEKKKIKQTNQINEGKVYGEIFKDENNDYIVREGTINIKNELDINLIFDYFIFIIIHILIFSYIRNTKIFYIEKQKEKKTKLKIISNIMKNMKNTKEETDIEKLNLGINEILRKRNSIIITTIISIIGYEWIKNISGLNDIDKGIENNAFIIVIIAIILLFTILAGIVINFLYTTIFMSKKELQQLADLLSEYKEEESN